MGSTRQGGQPPGIATIAAGGREGSGSASSGPRGDAMRAIVQNAYGSVDVLRLAEIDKPDIAADEVLVKVHAAGMDRGTWHNMTGQPYLMRIMGFGFRAPKNPVAGLDVAGTVDFLPPFNDQELSEAPEVRDPGIVHKGALPRSRRFCQPMGRKLGTHVLVPPIRLEVFARGQQPAFPQGSCLIAARMATFSRPSKSAPHSITTCGPTGRSLGGPRRRRSRAGRRPHPQAPGLPDGSAFGETRST